MKKNNIYLLIIILFGVIYFLPFLGVFELTSITEGEYSGVAKEMVNRSEFISPYFNKAFWADKPPLHIWLLSISGYLGGWSEFSLRLPGVLMTILTGLLIFFIGKRFFSVKIGLIGTLIFYTLIETLVAGQVIFVDMTLTFFITLAFYQFVRFFETNNKNKKLQFIILFFIAMAGAVMTKGLIGIIIPAGGAFIYLIWSSQMRIFKDYARELLIGLGAFLALAAPWYIIEIIRHDMVFIERFFLYFNIDRFIKGVDNINPWYYYLIIIPLTLFPWSSFLLPFIKGFSRIKNKHFTRAVAGISLFTLVFFTLSRTKLHTYLLPLYPLWSLVAAYGWNEFWEQKQSSLFRFFSGILIIFPLTAVALYIASSNVDGNNLSYLITPVIIVFIVVFLGIIIGITRKIRVGNYYLILLVLMMLISNLTIKGYIMPHVQNNYLYLRDFCQSINELSTEEDRIGVTTRNATNVPFYIQKRIDFAPKLPDYLEQNGIVFIILPENELDFPAQIIQEKAGWVLVTNK
jgi:4-amino-4-deoxy-L-arabinose transferase-like glycosyltransferase